MKPHRLILGAAGAFALLVAGCSSDAESSPAGTVGGSSAGGTSGTGASGLGGSGGNNPSGGSGGSTSSGGAASATFPTERGYVHQLFETQAECDAFQQQGGNCEQIVDFCPDGSGSIVVTDILNDGTYAIDGDKIDATWPMGDAPPTMVFILTSDTEIVYDADSSVWVLDPSLPQNCN